MYFANFISNVYDFYKETTATYFSYTMA